MDAAFGVYDNETCTGHNRAGVILQVREKRSFLLRIRIDRPSQRKWLPRNREDCEEKTILAILDPFINPDSPPGAPNRPIPQTGMTNRPRTEIPSRD